MLRKFFELPIEFLRDRLGLALNIYHIYSLLIAGIVVTSGMLLLRHVFTVEITPWPIGPENEVTVEAAPWSVGIFVLLEFVGVILVGNVTFAVLQRVDAKNQLALILAGFGDGELAYVRSLIIEGLLPTMFPYRLPEHTSPDSEVKFAKLFSFLNFDPTGQLASQALFQRSRIGRLNYFNRLVRIARRYYQPRIPT
jgi:hypothetical protein